MLPVSQNLHDSIVRERVGGLVLRIDSWLMQEMGGWQSVQEGRRHALLREILDDAQDSRMQVESDFALYCHLMLSRGPSWRDVRKMPQVCEAVEDEELNPGSKLLRIESALAGVANVREA